MVIRDFWPATQPVRDAALSVDALSPDQLEGLRVWLRADAIAGLADGDPVATWPDGSGSGNDAAQGTPSKRPTYRTGILNARPVVRFDGVDDWLTCETGFDLNAYTFFTVMTFAQPIDDYLDRSGVWALASDTNDRLFLMSGGFSTGDRLYASAETAGGAEISKYTVNLAAGAPLVAVVQWGPAGLQLFVNGAAQALSDQPAVAPPVSAAAELRLGQRYGVGFTEEMEGDIAEFILYSRVLPTDERRRVERYLGRKWGVALP